MSMLDTAIGLEPVKTAKQVETRKNLTKFFWIFLIASIAGGMAFLMVRDGPTFSDLAWIIFWIFIGLTILNPRYGIYIILFNTLVGDNLVSYWLPFNKNFSSAESLLYYNENFSFTPLEIFIALTAVVWVVQALLKRDFRLKTGPLFWPGLIFTFFIAVGLIYGLVTGGNSNIALWESRAIFYIFAMLLLTTNLIEQKEHVNILFWMILLALFVEALLGSYHFIYELEFSLAEVETLFEHSASIHTNLFLLFLVGAVLFKDVSGSKMLMVLLLVPPVLLTYFASQRRSAFVALGLAIALLFVFLYRERRHLFRYIAPPTVVIALLYMAIFWNSGSALGLPVQAVKSVIAPNSISVKDQSSNLYRITENLNAEFTIHQSPLMGVGFGNKFFILYPLPDISFFVWWEYITHNSILWIWMKSGFFGFASMIFLAAMSILIGVRAVMKLGQSEMRIIGLSFTLYLLMHFVFAYVDISWTDQSMVLVGTAMGVLNMFVHSPNFKT